MMRNSMFISDHLLDDRPNQGNMTEVITADTWVKRQLQLIRICIDIRNDINYK